MKLSPNLKAFAALTLFVGPTAYGLDLSDFTNRGATVRPPLRRDDIPTLMQNKYLTKDIAIVDGVFHQALSVSHKEILLLLRSGHEVWGLSSIGAIRAAEMDYLGMKGYGEVYKQFKCALMTDDEVAVLHSSEYPFEPLTEPLVHLRTATTALEKCGLINARIRARVVKRLRRLWFGDRSVAMLYRLLSNELPEEQMKKIASAMHDFSRFRLKTADLCLFLNFYGAKKV